MSTKHIQKGDVIDFTTTGAVAVNDVITIGPLVGVALSAALAAGEVIAVAISEVWLLPKNNAVAMSQGDVVDWDASASEFLDNIGVPAVGDITDGCIVMEDAVLAATEVKVLLNAGKGTLN